MTLDSSAANPLTLDIPQGAALISLRAVNLVYASGRRSLTALHNVNLDLHPEDFVCVIGPSGCGKSSLLRVIAGYERPSQGYITVAGKPHTKPNAEVGVVFQQPNLFPWLTVAQNVDFSPRMQGLSQTIRQNKIEHYLQMVGLIRAANLFPHELSGGMKQRVAIARSLAADPKVILMDEPFAALDALTREAMQDYLRQIWRTTQKTILFITHDVEEALLLATRIVVMYANPGRIVKDIENPFARRLEHTSATELRSSREFLELRQELVSSIKEAHLANV
ncbi:MAG TPA: ABC transporter ATP-binding protein [Chroococcidiopsis sp.]